MRKTINLNILKYTIGLRMNWKVFKWNVLKVQCIKTMGIWKRKTKENYFNIKKYQ